MNKKSLALARQNRAQECTEEIRKYDNWLRKWAHIGKMIVEVEDNKLYLELGYENISDWLDENAPFSARLLSYIKSRYLRLSPYIPDEMLANISPQSAEWAKNPNNISPEALKNPDVQAALTLPPRKAIEAIQKIVPMQSVELSKNRLCKFALSQYDSVFDGFAAFKRLKDGTASFEDFVEFLTEEMWMQSKLQNGLSVREVWEQMKDHDGQSEEAPSRPASVAAV